MIRSGFAIDPCLVTLGKWVGHDSEHDSSVSVYELAKGLYTQVVRVVPKDGKRGSWVEKRYFDIGKFLLEASAYEKMAEIINGPGGATTFRMAKAEPQGNQTVLLEDVKGVALDSALADPGLTEEVKSSLRAVYRMKLKALQRLVQSRYPDAKVLESDFGGLPAHHYLVGSSRDRTELFVKSAQIIVTFDEKDPRRFSMTIVDPY